MTPSPISRNELHRRGLLDHTIGTPPKTLKPAIVIWGKHEPRHDNLPLIALATLAAGKPPVVYVDDVASRVFCRRSIAEQHRYNELYRSFCDSRGCPVRFSSDVYNERLGSDMLPALFELANRTSVSRFIRCLPKKKTAIFASLPASEIMNMLLELLLFEQVAHDCNTLVVRHFTQGIVLSHQKIASQPLPALVIPALPDEAIDAYVTKAMQLYPSLRLCTPNA